MGRTPWLGTSRPSWKVRTDMSQVRSNGTGALLRRWGVIGGPLAAALVVTVLLQSGAGFSPEDAGSVWGALYSDVAGVEWELEESLTAMVDSADVVVLATVASARQGRIVGDPDEGYYWGVSLGYNVSAFLDVEEVLKGRLVMGGRPEVEFFVFDAADVEGVIKELPGQRGVFALRNKGENARIRGQSGAVVQRESQYYRLISSQGFFLVEGGKVRTPARDEDDWTASQRGRSIEAFVGDVRSSG